MVILVSKEGQLANRIFHASHFIANAQEHHYRLRHFFLDDYYPFFSESLNESNISFKVVGKSANQFITFFQKIVVLFVKGLLKLKITKLPFLEIVNYEGYEQGAAPYDLNNKEFIEKATSKIILAQGWLFRDTLNFQKHQALLKTIWKPNKKYQDNIDDYYRKYKKDHDILIGVHVRGGDYRKFEGGKWYYTPQQYYNKIKEIASLLIFEGKRLGFVICTNEEMLLDKAEKFSIFYEQRHFVEDLYLLSKCDYITGPPSTFNMWASFYGDVPLYIFRDISAPISSESFIQNLRVHEY